MPIRSDACPGPCNGQARKAWDAYDQAVIRHQHEVILHIDAHQRWQQAMTGWQAAIPEWHPPYVLPPIEPARPEPPAQPTITVHAGFPWCSRCVRIIRHALAQLDDTAALLNAGVDGHRGAAVSGPNGTKPLAHTAIIEALDELYGDLVAVEDAWRAARGYPERPRRARGADARMRTVAWLLGVLDDLLLDPWSVEVGLSILAWQRRLLRMTKSDPTSRRSPIACPRCQERQVSRRDDGFYECLCGRLLNQAEHDREKDEQAEEYDHEREVAAS